MSRSPVLFSSDDEDEGSAQEAEVLKKFQILLQGVPPPSSVTMSKLSASEMLEKYKENESLFGVTSQALNVSQRFSHKNSTPLVYYSNTSQTSEDIANLSQKIQARYIYSETMSSCNIWFDTILKTNSAKKKSSWRNGFALSPGSRLSHLARRRQVFSCENLQQLANFDKRRHIEINKPSALKTRTLERNKTVELDKVNSFKRALFLSPDDKNTKKVNAGNDASFDKGKVTQGSSKIVAPLFKQHNQSHMGGSSLKKRKRKESRESNWPRRALTFSEEDSVKSQETNLRNAQVISELQLSLHHKSKLLWAVSLTLKEKNMSSKDPQFKTCASALFMICRKNLGKILNSKRERGTSEKMLYFAREHVDGIFKKLGISNSRSLEQTSSVKIDANLSSPSKHNCSELPKENLDYFIKFGEDNSFSKKESSSNTRIGEDQTNINEKENINVTEKSCSFC